MYRAIGIDNKTKLSEDKDRLSEAILNYNPNSQRKYNSNGSYTPDDKEKIVKIIKSIFSKGSNLNEIEIYTGENDDYRKKYLNYPFFVALKQNHLDLLELLISYGANVNIISGNYDGDGTSGRRPLEIAIRNNNLDLLSFLIKNGANINLPNEYNLVSPGGTPLFYTTCRTNPEIVKLLLKNGGDVNYLDNAGNTAFSKNRCLKKIYDEELSYQARKPLIQMTEGINKAQTLGLGKVSRADDSKLRYFNEMNVKEISSYLDHDTKGGKYKRKSRKSRKSMKPKKSMKSKKSKKSRKYKN